MPFDKCFLETMHLFSLLEIKGDITHLPPWLDNRGNALCEGGLLSTLNIEGAVTFWLFYHWCVFFFSFLSLSASLVTQIVKNLPAMQETWVRSLR